MSKLSKRKISEIIEVSSWPPSGPDLNSLDYAVWGILENKINATFLPNIGLLKTAVEEGWNKIPEDFILNACKSFRRCVNTLIEKMVAILSKFIGLCP